MQKHLDCSHSKQRFKGPPCLLSFVQFQQLLVTNHSTVHAWLPGHASRRMFLLGPTCLDFWKDQHYD